MWLVVIALNYEYVGRLEVAHWRRRQSPLAQQQVALGNLVEAIKYLLAKSDTSFPSLIGVKRWQTSVSIMMGRWSRGLTPCISLTYFLVFLPLAWPRLFVPLTLRMRGFRNGCGDLEGAFGGGRLA